MTWVCLLGDCGDGLFTARNLDEVVDHFRTLHPEQEMPERWRHGYPVLRLRRLRGCFVTDTSGSPYTEADIERIGRIIHTAACTIEHLPDWRITDADEDAAREILDALASAGRLLPEGAGEQYWERKVRISTVRKLLNRFGRATRQSIRDDLGLIGGSRTELHDDLTDWLLRQESEPDTPGCRRGNG